jgi:nitrilase
MGVGEAVRVAAVQAAPARFDTGESLRKLAELRWDAARRGAKLVDFPEAFIAGDPEGHDFGVSVGRRTPEGRDESRRLFEAAVEVPGPATEAIGAAARDCAVHHVVGVVEREGGTLYCSVPIVGPDGTLLGEHRKRMPTAMERVLWGSGDGRRPGHLGPHRHARRPRGAVLRRVGVLAPRPTPTTGTETRKRRVMTDDEDNE